MRFNEGDIIEVSTPDDIQYVGKALQSRDLGGWAWFSIRLSTGREMDFNLNSVKVRLLYTEKSTDA